MVVLKFSVVKLKKYWTAPPRTTLLRIDCWRVIISLYHISMSSIIKIRDMVTGCIKERIWNSSWTSQGDVEVSLNYSLSPQTFMSALGFMVLVTYYLLVITKAVFQHLNWWSHFCVIIRALAVARQELEWVWARSNTPLVWVTTHAFKGSFIILVCQNVAIYHTKTPST